MNWKKIWNFIWHEDSIASWAVNIIIAFILIKFIFYPVLGFILGTSHPIVAVVSGSMEHSFSKETAVDGVKYELCGKITGAKPEPSFSAFWETCGQWYENNGITKEQFSNFKMKNGFNKGDLIILSSKENAKQGDIIVFWSNRQYPIIHRIIESANETFRTKGDHNVADDGLTKKELAVGKAFIKIPYAGWIKIWFVELIELIKWR